MAQRQKLPLQGLAYIWLARSESHDPVAGEAGEVSFPFYWFLTTDHSNTQKPKWSKWKEIVGKGSICHKRTA
jgi:hypothetical protein